MIQPNRQLEIKKKEGNGKIGAFLKRMWSRQESNLDLEFRKLLFFLIH